MSVANLLASGRQANTNLHANSVALAQLSTAERDALPATDGTVSYDTQLDKLYVRANGAWEQVQSGAGSSSAVVLFGPTASVSVPTNQFWNVMPSNISTPVSSGITTDTAGYAVIPSTGLYKVSAQVTVNPPAPISNGVVALSITDDTGTVGYFRTVQVGFTAATSSLSQWTLATQGIVQLTAGSKVTMFIENTGTGGGLTVSAMGSGPRVSYIMIEKV